MDEQFTPTENLKSDVLRLIKWRGDGLSFVELCRFLPIARGESNIEFEKNLWLWNGVSLEIIAVLNELISEGAIHYEVCGMYTYLHDGGGLTLPIGEAHKHYRSPHWLPLVIKLGKLKAAA